MVQSLAPPKEEAFPDHWTGISRLWNEVGPPLRPSAEDLVSVASAVTGAATVGGPKRGLVLGSTPEFYDILQRQNIRPIAMDLNRSMLQKIWPAESRSRITGDWARLPLADASVAVALCDAGTIHLTFPEGLATFGRELRRVLRSGGVFVTRLITPPNVNESPEAVVEALLAGRIPNLNILKVRLGIALQSNSEGGVRLSDVWDFVSSLESDLGVLAQKIGWPGASLLALRTYRDSQLKYHFIAREAFLAVLENECKMRLFACHTPSYELGAQCPTLVMQSAE